MHPIQNLLSGELARALLIQVSYITLVRGNFCLAFPYIILSHDVALFWITGSEAKVGH